MPYSSAKETLKLHIQYLCSLEDSVRVRRACVTYLQNWYGIFYPERRDIIAELQALATELQGRLEPPNLGWKYTWVRATFGRKTAKWTQTSLLNFKSSCIRQFDKATYKLEARRRGATLGFDAL